MIRSGSVWFFTPSNPKLTFGGMDGEPKKEMHDLLPAGLCPVYFNVKPSEDIAVVKDKMKFYGIEYPLIVKPEVGGQGILFRKIDNEEHLKEYNSKVPAEYFIQEFIKYSVEVSLFYYRYPYKKKGTITGFLQKVPMRVKGDGLHTLEQLIRGNDKCNSRLDELRLKHGKNFERIIPEGENYILSYAGNHNRGAHFIDLSAEINEELVNILDEISTKVNDFFYGRYDIMCNSVEDLKKGRNFVILEYNGCGAEPNHFYDTGYTLTRAWKEILKHWKILYEISRYNHQQGVAYWPLMKGIQFRIDTKKYFKIAKQADKIIS